MRGKIFKKIDVIIVRQQLARFSFSTHVKNGMRGKMRGKMIQALITLNNHK